MVRRGEGGGGGGVTTGLGTFFFKCALQHLSFAELCHFVKDTARRKLPFPAIAPIAPAMASFTAPAALEPLLSLASFIATKLSLTTGACDDTLFAQVPTTLFL